MEREELEEFYKKKIKIKLNLKDNTFLTGYIINFKEKSLTFLDKYGNEIPVDYDMVGYPLPVKEKGGEKDG